MSGLWRDGTSLILGEKAEKSESDVAPELIEALHRRGTLIEAELVMDSLDAGIIPGTPEPIQALIDRLRQI